MNTTTQEELLDILNKCAQWFWTNDSTAVLPGKHDTALNDILRVVTKIEIEQQKKSQ